MKGTLFPKGILIFEIKYILTFFFSLNFICQYTFDVQVNGYSSVLQWSWFHWFGTQFNYLCVLYLADPKVRCYILFSCKRNLFLGEVL